MIEPMNAAEIRRRYSYSPQTGEFRNLETGSLVGSVDRHGYIKLTIGYNHTYRIHRLAWLYHYGEWPAGRLDHINRNRADNRIENLRLCSQSQNKANAGANKNSASGRRGVSWHRRRRKWLAQIMVRGKNHYLGCFTDIESASKAYEAALQHHFGEFALVE